MPHRRASARLMRTAGGPSNSATLVISENELFVRQKLAGVISWKAPRPATGAMVGVAVKPQPSDAARVDAISIQREGVVNEPPPIWGRGGSIGCQVPLDAS